MDDFSRLLQNIAVLEPITSQHIPLDRSKLFHHLTTTMTLGTVKREKPTWTCIFYSLFTHSTFIFKDERKSVLSFLPTPFLQHSLKE